MKAGRSFRRAGIALVTLAILLSVTLQVAAPQDQGSPPQITSIDFPTAIQADGNPVEGLIFFSDPDGDVVKAKFELMEGDRDSLQLTPGWEFDPGVKGQTEGVIEFQVAATAGGTFKLKATLEDEAGNASEPMEFEFETLGGVGAQPSQPCTTTVQPGQSIQAAIDAAPKGAVICLEAGTWEENLKIEKSLTLRGTGAKETIIKGKKHKTVLRIESDEEISVGIEGLTVAEAKGPYGSGIEIAGEAKVTIQNSRISNNSYIGIWMGYSAQAIIENSQISDNGDGINMVGSAQATIQNSQISNNRWYGIGMEDSAQVTIENNTIQGNRWCGIKSSSDKPVQGKGNLMEGNGVDLCGNLSARLREPLEPETGQKELSFPGPYPTLQRTIDALAPGGTITLAAGEHPGGLTIWKPLTLKGAEGTKREEVEIVGAVSLISEAQEVRIEGVTIRGSTFTGLVLGGQARATIANSQISDNVDGIVMKGSAQATIQNSQISNNERDGIWMGYSAQAIIQNSQISNNEGDGIVMVGSAQATIQNSRILDNEWRGILMVGSAQAEIRGSTIEGNGTHESCKKKDKLCNGIHVFEESQVKLISSKVLNNADWGVGAALKQCGWSINAFTGKVTFEGNNTIEGNNTSGNQDGMDNPGDHPFTNLPDGQVCLP